jgi:hypothetical protein
MVTQPRLAKDPEDIVLKFAELIAGAEEVIRGVRESGGEHREPDRYFKVLVSALNLLGRISPGLSVYVRQLEDLYPNVNASIVKGILEAARTD